MTPAGPEIPAVAVLVPFLVVAVAAVVLRLRRDGFTGPRLMTGLVACGYAAVLLDAVLLPYPLHPKNGDVEMPWQVWINLVPLASGDAVGIGLNLLLFVPLGVLLPLLLGGISLRRAALVGLLVSLSIELVQLAGSLTLGNGRVFDVDDLVPNTLGVVVGYVLLHGAARIPFVGRLVEILRWAAPVTDAAGAGRRPA